MFGYVALNAQCIKHLTDIHELLGSLTYAGLGSAPNPNRSVYWSRTVTSTLRIEGSPLTREHVEQIHAAPAQTEWERAAQNALRAYQGIKSFKPWSERSFKCAHLAFMDGLIPRAGAYRSTAVALQQGGRIVHVAPPATSVPGLMRSLFASLKSAPLGPVVASCVFHYELEFTHPFADGNGRIGRFWHTVLLRQIHPIFDQLSIEEVLDRERDAYYQALARADRSGTSLPFVEFMLGILAQTLRSFLNERPSPPQCSEDRIQYFVEYGPPSFARKDYLEFFPSISEPTASRDLKLGSDQGHWIRSGTKRTATYVVPRPNERPFREAANEGRPPRRERR